MLWMKKEAPCSSNHIGELCDLNPIDPPTSFGQRVSPTEPRGLSIMLINFMLETSDKREPWSGNRLTVPLCKPPVSKELPSRTGWWRNTLTSIEHRYHSEALARKERGGLKSAGTSSRARK
ncbi:hypothetical protein ACOMHN_013025 [Nucella lapillus]